MSLCQTRAKLYDFVAQVTNWKPKGVGICKLSLSEGGDEGGGPVLTGVDERGEQVLHLALLPSMNYSRPASTFHSIETGKNVGVALYFGSAQDEWFDPASSLFAERVESELARLRATVVAPIAPAVPIRRPPVPVSPAPVPRRVANPLTKSSSTVEVAVAEAVPVQPLAESAPKPPEPLPDPPKIPEIVRASESDPEVHVEELIAMEKNPRIEVAVARPAPPIPALPAIVPAPEKKIEELDWSTDIDFSTLETLPPLPSEVPPNNGGKEYKNYQKLKMEILRRNPDAVIPAAPPAPVPGTSPRRNTAAGRSKSPPAKRAAQQPPPQARKLASPRELESNVKMVAPEPTVAAPAAPKAPEVASVVAEVAASNSLPQIAEKNWNLQLQSIVEYPDGSRYVGELLAGVKHGKG